MVSDLVPGGRNFEILKKIVRIFIFARNQANRMEKHTIETITTTMLANLSALLSGF